MEMSLELLLDLRTLYKQKETVETNGVWVTAIS